MLAYDDAGSGLPIVLIHGFPLNRRMWAPQIAGLVAAGYRVICPDLPGFGETTADKDIKGMDTYADALVALMDRLGIERAVIGGMSMGGYVLLNLLERYPKRCLGALFLVTRAAADDAAGKQKRGDLAREVEAGNRLIVPDTFAQVLFAPTTPEEKPELVAEVRQWMEQTSPEGIIGGLLAMRDRADYVAQLPGFKLPSLVLGAELDMAVPVDHACVLAAGLPDASLEIIQGAGHMVNLEKPDTFNQALLAYLAKLRSE